MLVKVIYQSSPVPYNYEYSFKLNVSYFAEVGASTPMPTSSSSYVQEFQSTEAPIEFKFEVPK